MGFRFRCFGVGWCLLLLALTCLSQENQARSTSAETARGSSSATLWSPISGAFRSFQNKVSTGINSLFQPAAKPGGNSGELNTAGTTTIGPGSDDDERYREIINAPLRCPPEHIIVDGRCRRKVRR